MRRRGIQILVLAFGVICAIPFRGQLRALLEATAQFHSGEKSVADRLVEFGDVVRSRLSERFQEIGASYPPRKLLLVGLKQERRLEVWVSDGGSGFRYLKSYRILGASGTPGPKLREGDQQVPEGLYKIDSLNPNSQFHLALRVDYPNNSDQKRGRGDGRANLGSDIMIHGGSASVGCLAVGDEAAEDVFVLAAETGLSNVALILAPVDFRVKESATDWPKLPGWTSELYDEIRKALAPLKRQPGSASRTETTKVRGLFARGATLSRREPPCKG